MTPTSIRWLRLRKHSGKQNTVSFGTPQEENQACPQQLNCQLHQIPSHCLTHCQAKETMLGSQFLSFVINIANNPPCYQEMSYRSHSIIGCIRINIVVQSSRKMLKWNSQQLLPRLQEVIFGWLFSLKSDFWGYKLKSFQRKPKQYNKCALIPQQEKRDSNQCSHHLRRSGSYIHRGRSLVQENRFPLK